MELTLCALADAANTSEDGKVNLLGVFSSIYAMQVPATHPTMSLAMIFRASAGEKGRMYQVSIKLIDPDGNQIGPTPEFGLSVPQDAPGLAPAANIVINLQQLQFPKYGNYAFDILVNGNSLRQVPISIEVPPADLLKRLQGG
jgi:hypothetical protein